MIDVGSQVEYEELKFLKGLLDEIPKDKRDNHVFNIGIFKGSSTLVLAEGMKEYNYSGNLFTVGICRAMGIVAFDYLPMRERRDVYLNSKSVYEEAVENITKYDVTDKIVIHHGFSDSLVLESCLGNKEISFVFIDGDHSTHGVLLDLLKYSQNIISGGLVVLHDFPAPFVSKAIKIFLDIRPDFREHNKYKGVLALRKES